MLAKRLGLGCLLLCGLLTATAHADDRKLAETKKQAGDALAAEGKAEEALAAYEAAMDADASYQPAYDAAAPLWFRAAKYDVAIRRLGIAVARRPKYAMGWYNLAFAYRKTQDYPKAVEAYQKFIELRPKEPDPYFGLGMTFKAMGEVEQARTAFAKYIELEKRPEKQKFVDQARAELAVLDGAVPGEVPPPAPAGTPREVATRHKQDGDVKRDAGDLAGAEVAYRAAIEADPTYGPAHKELGAILFLQKRNDEAIPAFREAVKLDANDDAAWYDLAHALRKSGSHAEAVDAYKAYITLKPHNPDPYYGLGHSLRALGDREGARAAFAKYIELEKRETEQRWVEKARQEIAAIEAEEASSASASQPTAEGGVPASAPSVAVAMPTPTREQAAEARAYVERGDQSFAGKQYEEAGGSYRAAIALDPTNAEARYRLGVALAAHGDLAAAMVAWEGVLLVAPTHERARRNIELARERTARSDKRALVDEAAVLTRARALIEEGRHASALAMLDTLLADPLHAQLVEALMLRAEARLGAGDADGAIVDWLSVVALDPRGARAYRGLGEAYVALGDIARGRYFYELFLLRAEADPIERAQIQTVRYRLQGM